MSKLVTKRVVGGAQILLSVLFVTGYFVILWAFIHGDIHPPPEWKDVLQSLLSILTAGVLTILHFWFSRSRPEDPNVPPTA